MTISGRNVYQGRGHKEYPRAIVEYRMEEEEAYSNVAAFPSRWSTTYPCITGDTGTILREFSISLDQVADVAGRSWDEVKRILEDELKREGFLRADAVADALIEEAKARASTIVKEELGSDVPELSEKVAKYIIAFALAEKPVKEEEEIAYIQMHYD